MIWEAHRSCSAGQRLLAPRTGPLTHQNTIDINVVQNGQPKEVRPYIETAFVKDDLDARSTVSVGRMGGKASSTL